MRSGKLVRVDTRNTQELSGAGEAHEAPGLGAWIQRNPWLLLRLFIVMVFTFGASTTAANFSYGLEGEPIVLSAEQINRGQLPPGTEIGDYVEIRGTPQIPDDLKLEQLGSPESKIAISSRYSTTYFYFELGETGDNLLLQTVESLTDPETGERVWRGKLSNVGTVIFHDTTQEGLRRAGLPRDENIPVVETGDTPEYYRKIFPAYSAIIGLWIASVVWLVWKKNKPFLGL